MSADEHGETTTIIHDAILGTTSLSLADALAIDEHKIDARDNVGYAPLHWTAIRGELDTVQILLEHAAKVDVRAEYTQYTPLHLASAFSHPEICRALVEGGADVNAKNLWGGTPLSSTLDFSTASALLDVGADPDMADNSGLAPLHYIINRETTDTHASIRLLADKGADLNKRCPGENDQTPVMRAMSFDRVESVWSLCRLGARLDLADANGDTLLHYAAVFGKLEMLARLRAEMDACWFRHGNLVDQDCRNGRGLSPLQTFRKRMASENSPVQVAVTHGEVFAFCALVIDLRRGSRELGRRPEMKDEDDVCRRLQRWLGWLLRRMQEDDKLSSRPWDGGLPAWFTDGDGGWGIKEDEEEQFLGLDAVGDEFGLLFDEVEEVEETSSESSDVFFDAMETC